MELFPYETAHVVFNNPIYQKWEYQKPFILIFIKYMEELQSVNNIMITDIKPSNILYDPVSRKIVIIDIGKSISLDKKIGLENFDISNLDFGISIKYCSPELIHQQDKKINIRKIMSYLYGATLASLTSIEEKGIEINDWKIGDKTDLDENQKKELQDAIKSLLNKDQEKRLDIKNAKKTLRRIEVTSKVSLTNYMVK